MELDARLPPAGHYPRVVLTVRGFTATPEAGDRALQRPQLVLNIRDQLSAQGLATERRNSDKDALDGATVLTWPCPGSDSSDFQRGYLR